MSVSLDDRLRSVETGDVEDAKYMAALDKLNADQEDWLQRWIQEGYTDRRDVLLKLHQLQLLTLGRMPNGWYPKVTRNNVILSVLITSENRTRWRTDPVSLSDAKQERRRLAAKFIRPAFRAAYRDLHTEVKQYTNEGERIEDIDDQHFALRPVMTEVYEKQTQRLLELLDGFEDTDRVDRWLQGLDDACRGKLSHVRQDFDYEVVTNPVVERVLTEDSRDCERERELLAGRYLLPAYNIAIGYIATKADEHQEQQSGTFGTKGL